ncbi:hypothetical protein GCM10009122_53670 [Fulvivirga kasyanovii]|uniref:LysM peptidoglycan-binding domain-containing protein n=1 Tax=Fulvivirga kasyanovii TaxID=396812 RepID=A0ABW9RU32_9BACT|nr:LysM peptidoglycan-binding domain-containing protein [Fulvivirga kasyanovii]MTI27698.1 LysM peptidoglycan-binding domain-containing protein [Fulvivirga kasyanovii]
MAKLKIESYKDEKLGAKLGSMELMFNPSTLSLSHSIDYHDEPAPNRSSPEARYKKTEPEILSFEIMFDGTGVAAEPTTVSEKVETFKELTYYYIGDTHQTPYVNVIWGDINFKGRLKSLDIKHTLFDTEGTVLRSNLTVSFTNTMDLETEAKESDRQSPDLTHVRSVKAGDTLPLLCNEIYGDPGLYLKVARINGLTDFRNLQPGTEVTFPPIK